jgi:hypothetical protein
MTNVHAVPSRIAQPTPRMSGSASIVVINLIGSDYYTTMFVVHKAVVPHD